MAARIDQWTRKRVVPLEHTQAIFDAKAGPKQRIIVPFAGHIWVLFGREQWFAEQVQRLASGQ